MMIRKHGVRCVGLALAVVLGPACSSASERRPAQRPPQSLAERIDAQVSRVIGDGPQPGASVAVAGDGKLLLAKGYGLADVKAGVPAGPGTVYRIGSVTKQFTAAAVMDLVEHGRLGVDDEVTRHLPEYPAGGERPTVRDLLTHTSGIPNYTESPEFERLADRRVPRAEIMNLFAGRYDFPPGRQWAYSNSNYFLLGLIVERVSAMAYADYLSDRIFTPLAMRDTSYCPDEPSGRQQAKGYQLDSGHKPMPADPLSMQHPFAAGALCSTVEDLVRWSEAFHGHRFLSAGSHGLMTTPTTLANGTTYPYGFGLEIDDSTGVQIIAHGGGINGFLSWLGYLPDQRMTVVVLVNSTSAAGERLIQDVVRATRPECDTRMAEPHRGAPAPGEHAVPNGGFETGDLEGWTVQNQMGSLGDWFVHSGARSPMSCTPLGPVPEGRNGATTEPCGRFRTAPGVAPAKPSAPPGASGRCREAPDGPGTHILYRDIALAPGMTHELTFFVYYRNESAMFAPAETLDFAVRPNQQFRVDVLKPTATAFSVEPSDILGTVFQRFPGSCSSTPGLPNFSRGTAT